MGSKSPKMILMILPLVCAIIPAAIVAAALPPAIAQEETSLGDEADFAASIVSNLLGGSDNTDNDDDDEEETLCRYCLKSSQFTEVKPWTGFEPVTSTFLVGESPLIEATSLPR